MPSLCRICDYGENCVFVYCHQVGVGYASCGSGASDEVVANMQQFWVWGNQSTLQSSIIPRYFIFETTFNPHKDISGWLLYASLFLINIGINADLCLEISSLCFLHQSSVVWSVFTTVVRTTECLGPESLSICRRRMLPFLGFVSWIVA